MEVRRLYNCDSSSNKCSIKGLRRRFSTKYPVAFKWQGRQFTVRNFGGHWYQGGCWWEGEGEKRFLRVQTAQGPVADLWFEPQTGKWGLHQMYD